MLSILYNIIISPLELIFEFVFVLMFRLVGRGEENHAIAVIAVSLAISFLTLPLYLLADSMQKKERAVQLSMKSYIERIRGAFSGDERFMMLQAYYRERGYSPLHALKGSVSLLLEIPFFIAAYHFLSHLEVLNGASFGVISDLGKPDGLLGFGMAGGVRLNLLPILMTAINCVSAAVYLKGFSLKDKIQTYGMALIFLVLLYNSPSGLVIYWTSNNLFSLAKNIFYRLKNPRKVAVVLCAVIGTLFPGVLMASGALNSLKKYLCMIFFMILSYIPLVVFFLKVKISPRFTKKEFPPVQKSVFIISAFSLSVLLGLLIPSFVIESSPAEFVDVNLFKNPIGHLIFPFCHALGFFVLWAGVVILVLGKNAKRIFSAIMFALTVRKKTGNKSIDTCFISVEQKSVIRPAMKCQQIIFENL